MNTKPIHCASAMDDGDLMQLVDGEIQGGEAAKLRAHVAACSACRERIDELTQRTANLSRRFQTYDRGFPSPGPAPRVRAFGVHTATPRAQSWARAATILLFLGGSLFAIPMVRAWIADLAGGDSGAPAVPETPARPQQAPLSREPGTTIAYSVEGPEFLIEIVNVPHAGTLVLRKTGGEQAVAQILGQFGGERFLLLPEGLTIQNTPGSRTDYRIDIPRGVRRVRVQLGGELLASLDVRTPSVGQQWSLELARRPSSEPLQSPLPPRR